MKGNYSKHFNYPYLHSNWPTIPQVFVGGAFIGGRDITYQLYKSGELKDMLKKHDALVSEEKK